LATENDSLNGVTMLFGHLLSDAAQIFADVRTYWSPAAVRRVTGKILEGRAANGVIHLINSGAATLDGTGQQSRNSRPVMKPYWEITPEEVERCLGVTRWCPANLMYFRGGGFSSQFTTRGEMPVTMSRLNLVRGLGPVLQIAEGWTVDLPPEVHNTMTLRTDPAWPTTWFVPNLTGEGPFKDVYSVMSNWGANHGAVSYGHIGDRLITLASMLHIPVCMHNVASGRIFRPSVWSAFGAQDPQGADFRACANFGPTYGKR
jgi:L-fucose isomerase